MVGSAALVASGRSGTASEPASRKPSGSASEAAATDWRATAHVGTSWVGARSSQVAGLAAVVAASTGSGAAQAQGRAVGLNVPEALAVIALFGLSGARQRALVRLVSWLLAVIAKALSRGANLGVVANIATLVTSTA